MRAAAPRTLTPTGADAQAVEPSSGPDVTQREVAPPVRRTPVGGVTVEPVRSRKATLASPIPALLAASMGEFREDKGDATPLPIDLRNDATSRLDTREQQSLLFEDDSEYVVEVDDPDKTGK
jgi:hypothetical protein